MLFPGADTLPGGYGSQWPGWKFENMQWIAGEFNFYQVREPGAYVIFELNPSVQVEVTYPGATEDCNPNPNPPIAEDDDMTAIPVYEFGFDNIVNVLNNDRLLDGTSPLNTTLVDITEVGQSTPGALILDPATGLVDVAPGLAPGIYTLEYRICTNPNPTNCDTAIVTVRVVSPGILVEKSVLENDNQVDGFITYEIKVTNTGDVELFNIEVMDDLTGDMWTISSLAPQEVWSETTQLSIDQELIDGECVTNTATAIAYAEEEGEASDGQSQERRVLARDEDSVEECFDINADIALVKSAEVESEDDCFDTGDLVTYTFVVTNTGNVTLTSITLDEINFTGTGTLSDVEFVSSSMGSIEGTLMPGETATYTATYEITLADTDARFINNQALATGFFNETEVTDLSGESLDSDVETQIDLCQRPAIELLKDGIFNDENQDGFGNVGETITYIFTVSNTGNVTLSDITVTDPMVTVNGGPISLAPGESDNTTFTATYELTQQDIDNGYVVNLALAEGTSPTDEVVEDESSDPTPVEEPSTDCETCTETEIPQNPAIELLKDGIFNDENQDGFGNVGETITYIFTVSNTGNVTLSNITVTDPLVTVNGGPISLAPGESDNTTFTATYELTQQDIDNGYVVNLALAEGTSPTDEVVEDESSDPTPVENPSTECETCTEVVIPQNPSINIDKTADPTSVDAAGQEVTYTLTVTNTGNTTLAGVTINDPLTGFSENVGSMVPGQVVVRETTYVVTQADIDNGSIVNVADVFAFSGQTPVSDEDDAVVEAIQRPGITMDKTADPTSVDAAGQEVTYTLTVTNTGNTTLAGVTINDPLTGFSENVGSMVPGQVVVRETTYVVTQADIDNGSIVNVADVFAFSGQTPVSDEDDAVVEAIQRPGITMDKTADPTSVDAAGQEVTYTLTVTNTGNTTLAGVTINDPLTGFSENVGSMVPGQVVVRETTYVVTQADIDNGSIVNVADVFAFSGQTPVSDEDDAVVEAIRNPSIQVIKTDNGAEVSEAGDVITYTLTVTNTGNVTLTNVTVEDPLTGLDVNVGTLAPGASTSVDTDYEVTQADVDAGFVLNTALTTGESPDEDDPEDDTDIETPIERNPSIQVIKTDNGAEVSEAGDVITYTLTVTNTGNVTLTNVTVEDPLTGLDVNVGALAPGESTSIDTDYVVTQADVDAGFVLNTALTTGESPEGEDDPEDETEIETPIDRSSSITISKEADVEAVQDEGEVINYTIVVTNTGNTTLTDVAVADPLTGLDEVIDVLQPGESVSFETSYTVTIADLADKQQIVNVATATFTDPVTEDEVTEEAEETVDVGCIDWTLVTGVVFNALTDQPLPNVPITLIPQGNTPGETLIVITDADGRYVFKDVPTGNYLIQVQDANLNAQGLFNFQKSSLAFREVEVCVPIVEDFQYAPFDGIILGDFVWYDLNQDGIQNEWFDANNDGQVTMNDLSAGPISIREWEWFDLNGDGRYDGPENEGELNKAGIAGNAEPGQSGNIRVTGPNGFETNQIVGILGYWRERIGATEDDTFDDQGGALYGEYNAEIIPDPVLISNASAMAATGLVKILPNAGGRMTDINSVRFEERCGLTTEDNVSAIVSAQDKVHLDMDFGWVCEQVEVEIIANDDDFGEYFVSYGGLLGNILDNDLLEGQRPDPADVDFEFTELDGVIGLLIDDNGELSLIPNVNEARAYTLRYVLRETAFPDNNDDALVFFRLLNDQVDLSVEKTSFEVEIYEGDEFEYEITVRNIGGTPATNVEIVDELPASVTYLSSSVVFTNDEQIQVGTPAVTGSRITWNVPFLPADGVIVFRVRVQAGDAGTITNIATVGAEEEDVDTTNNQDDDVNQVLPFRIPNVITPNNDGDNDSFEIKGLGKFVSNEITIFNRYGDHVLEQENYRNDWNAPGQVSGTYFFVLRTVDRSGREHEFTGWIQVIKED
ncbi:gliding motility-associated C-terminal domain-containing protein [Algoriphagus sp. NF]|uniref:DUF7507 domain-containing protein n=1 Tax=Algoriphagus sp. NF TaxID=2992756 RepID=UPI00237A5EE4|nr:gliding motility-associated C-terminal domain-containing protein [Algoriphagus sp. NF]MDE0558846.1 gliding motility-associated C-terminal domain-containing protein [Algoriphagus sp. NF]